MDGLCRMTAMELRAEIQKRTLGIEELTRLYLDRIEKSGLPSLALKLCTGEDGLPKGIIIYGADERRLLAAALTIETYCSPFCPPRLEA